MTVCVTRSRLGDAENDRLARVVVDILEDRVNTQIFCVFEQNFAVARSPRDSLCFEPPTNASPEVHSLFNAAFFAFVSRCLQKR